MGDGRRGDPTDDRHVAEMRHRLDEVEDDIDEVRRRTIDKPHERAFVDSGDEPDKDDQTIAPPG